MRRIRVVLLSMALAAAGHASAADPTETQASGCKEVMRTATCDCSPPAYPAYDVANENQGTVKAKVAVNADGNVERVTLSRSSGYKGLDLAAMAYFKRSCYTAGKDADGKPISGEIEMQYRFILK